MNGYFTGDPRGLDFMYYWDQFHPIIAAVLILIVGWIIALIVAAGIKAPTKIKYESQSFKCSRTYCGTVESA